MEIGTDDLDFIEDVDNPTNVNDTTTQDNPDFTPEEEPQLEEQEIDDNQVTPSNQEPEEEDFVLSLLKARGIEDKSKIKFENEDGQIEEVDWDSLSNEDKFNILNSSTKDSETDLDDSEIELINAIRRSNLGPNEYIQAVQQSGIDSYLRQYQDATQTYRIDEISDDDLFVMDLLSRTQDITEEEAFEALDRAKQNEALFKKQIGAMRTEYQEREKEALQYEEYQRQQQAQEQFQRFADSIGTSVYNFTELAGGKLDMTEEDMQELYEFITGFDAAGNSYFGKALNDPDVLVRMAWFALNGEQTIRDIEDYYNKEITKAREEGYKKGIAKAKDTPKVVHKNIQKPNNSKASEMFDDLDDI